MAEKKRKKFSVEIAPQECKGCRRCVNACPKSVLKIQENINKMGYFFATYTGDGCVGCGACFYNCPEPGTITIYEESEE